MRSRPDRFGTGERVAAAERGSGTVLTLGLAAVALVLFACVALLAQAVSARGATQAAADLGALAAAEHLRGSRVGPLPTAGTGTGAGAQGASVAACALARESVSLNGASLTGCAVLDDGVVQVTATRPGGLGMARASARAGPEPADAD